jgi:surface antigen
MKIRTTKPEAGNKYYIRKANGGYSNAILGNPTDKDCNVLANCVGYAYGRFNEIGEYGYCKYLAPVNAENFIDYRGSCQVGQTPKPGAVMVWQKGATKSGSDGAGHVAIVEKVISSTEVYTSESGWGSSKPFWNSTRKKGSGNWGAGSDYKFLGFIYNPAVPDEPTPQPTPTPSGLKYKVGDKVKFTGVLYRDSYGNGAGQSRTNLDATIWLVNPKGSHPYNINNGLGWVRESDLTKSSGGSLGNRYYTVVRGDTLWGIAKRFYGNGSRYPEIAKANNIADPDIIHIGQVLLIP